MIDLAMAQRVFAATPFMADLGVEPVAIADGQITTAMTLQPRHLQHTGQVHAGVMGAMADHSMGAAAQTVAPQGRWVVTAELKLSMLRAAKGERLVCEARVLKAGRGVTFTEAEVFVENAGQRSLAVKASATMALVEAGA